MKLRFRRSGGMASWTYGDMTWDNPCWKFQLYWPEVDMGGGNYHLMLLTTVRLVILPDREVGFGFQILGFGAGIVRMPRGISVKP